MARHKKVSLLTLAALGVAAARGVSRATNNFTDIGPSGLYIANGLSEGFIGYDFVNNEHDFGFALQNWGIVLAAYLGHIAANRIGLNKQMPDGVSV